jgi:hypothetical protein
LALSFEVVALSTTTDSTITDAASVVEQTSRSRLAALKELGDVVVALIGKWLAEIHDFTGVSPGP